MQDKYNTPWRLLATSIYSAPSDSKTYGTLDVDVAEAERYIREQREAGVRLTITHLVTAALARALAYDAPEVNCFIRRGKVVPRDRVDVMVAVSIKEGQEMASVKIRDAHLKPVSAIGEELAKKAADRRMGQEDRLMKNKYVLSKIPWPFRRWIFKLLRWIVNGLGFELKFLGLSSNAFGSILLSNIGTLGLTTAMPALFPAARLPAVIVMGKIERKPVVRDGEIVVRPIMPCTAAFDHRVVDAYQAGKLAHGTVSRLAKPAELELVP